MDKSERQIELFKKVSLILSAAEVFPDNEIKMSVYKTIDVDCGIELIADDLGVEIEEKQESFGSYKVNYKRVKYLGVTFQYREPAEAEGDKDV